MRKLKPYDTDPDIPQHLPTYLKIAGHSIKAHEGYSAKPYRDTHGVLTVGWGHNMEARTHTVVLTNGEIPRETLLQLFHEDLMEADSDAQRFFAEFRYLPEHRKAVLVEMAYNMGLPRLNGFILFRKALYAKDWWRAAFEMLDSEWHREDVGERAVTLARILARDAKY